MIYFKSGWYINKTNDINQYERLKRYYTHTHKISCITYYIIKMFYAILLLPILLIHTITLGINVLTKNINTLLEKFIDIIV